MKRIIKYGLIISLALFTALYFIYGYHAIVKIYINVAEEYYLVILSAVIIYLFILRKRLDFFENLLHELTHMLFSMLTFKKVSGLYVSATGGVVYTEGSQKSLLITLSPYFFPLFTTSLLVLFSLVKVEYGNQIIIGSYALFMIITFKHLIKDPNEVTATGFTGWLMLLVLTFWISYLLLSWITTDSLNVKEILTTTYDGFKRTLSQFKLV